MPFIKERMLCMWSQKLNESHGDLAAEFVQLLRNVDLRNHGFCLADVYFISQ